MYRPLLTCGTYVSVSTTKPRSGVGTCTACQCDASDLPQVRSEPAACRRTQMPRRCRLRWFGRALVRIDWSLLKIGSCRRACKTGLIIYHGAGSVVVGTFMPLPMWSPDRRVTEQNRCHWGIDPLPSVLGRLRLSHGASALFCNLRRKHHDRALTTCRSREIREHARAIPGAA